MRAAALVAALLLTGCVTPIVNYREMTPEQIKELVKDKAMAGNCIVLNTPYGRGVTTNIAIDKSVVAAGGTYTVDEQCKMTFTQGGPPAQVPVIVQDGQGGFRMVTPPPR